MTAPNQALATANGGGHLVARMAFTPDQRELIKSMFFKGATDDEFKVFLYVAEAVNLNPLLKQIHPVKRWDRQLGREAMQIQTGIDGYRLIANRTNRYRPGREATFKYDDAGKLISATSYIEVEYSDGWKEHSATALYSEYVQLTKEGKPVHMWQKMAHNQLAKCAEALIIRRAFPQEIGPVRSDEEMEQADGHVAEPEVIPPPRRAEGKVEGAKPEPTKADPPKEPKPDSKRKPEPMGKETPFAPIASVKAFKDPKLKGELVYSVLWKGKEFFTQNEATAKKAKEWAEEKTPVTLEAVLSEEDNRNWITELEPVKSAG